MLTIIPLVPEANDSTPSGTRRRRDGLPVLAVCQSKELSQKKKGLLQNGWFE
jgi:hypothetical protein